MADRAGHITTELRFGGNIRLSPPSSDYGKVRDPEAGERKRKIELFADAIKLDQEMKEIWDDD